MRRVDINFSYENPAPEYLEHLHSIKNTLLYKDARAQFLALPINIAALGLVIEKIKFHRDDPAAI